MKKTILLVDDELSMLNAYERLLHRHSFQTERAENGLSALAHIKLSLPDLILLDINMPGMSGHEVLEHINGHGLLNEVPVIVVSGDDKEESVIRCLELGAEDHIIKPFNPELLLARINRSLEKMELRRKDAKYREQIEHYALGLEDRVREQVRETTIAQLATIFALSKLAESRDQETGEHLERVRAYCKLLAQELANNEQYRAIIDEDYIETLYSASPLHDIGKVGIPDEVLQKPGKLTTDEFEIMKGHTTIGADALRAVHRKYPNSRLIQMGVDIAAAHHERWDGKGYPDGLQGESIPLSARILALADTYDALRSERRYKKAFSHEKSSSLIMAERAAQFAPDVVDAFDAVSMQFNAIAENSALVELPQAESPR